MKIGFISDIHANLEALSAVLSALSDADKILCCGDIVGYYDQPNEVCQLLRERDVLCIRGNHDAYVIGALEANPQRRKSYQTDWTAQTLTPQNLAWLKGLPWEINFEAEPFHIKLRHASPWDEETYIYPDSDKEIGRISLLKDEIMAVGHTHHPLHIKAGEGWLLNPGSVGQPRDYDPRAAYAVLDTKTGVIQLLREKYPVSKLQNRLSKHSWPQAMIDILSREK